MIFRGYLDFLNDDFLPENSDLTSQSPLHGGDGKRIPANSPRHYGEGQGERSAVKGKLPNELYDIIRDPKKREKLVIYINPPYAEVSTIGGSKKSVNQSSVHDKYADLLGTAGRELYAQFLIRIHEEIPNSFIGHFSTLKHLQGSAFEKFRQNFNAELKSLFVVPANTFDNVKGEFPIGFFIWDTSIKISFREIFADVFGKNGEFIGNKCVSANVDTALMTEWVAKEIPLNPNGEPIGFLAKTNSNDFQNNNIICILNKREQLPNPRGRWIDASSLIICSVYLAVRKSIEATWLNDRDQFLYPNDGWKTDLEFQSDCLAFTLFHGQNRISSEHGENHWIPFTEQEIGCKKAFKTHFMSDFIRNFMSGKYPKDEEKQGIWALLEEDKSLAAAERDSGRGLRQFSEEAQAVFDAGRELWKYYHSQKNANPDAAFYDIRKYFQGEKNGRMNAGSEELFLV